LGLTAGDVGTETFGTFVTNESMSAMGGKRPLRSSGDGLQFRFGDQFRRALLKDAARPHGGKRVQQAPGAWTPGREDRQATEGAIRAS